MERFEADKYYEPYFGIAVKADGLTVHNEETCEGDRCVIHKPTNHHMRSWPIAWRGDLGIFERECPHGVGHPDPDQSDYLIENNQEHKLVHGCDGCCLDNGAWV